MVERVYKSKLGSDPALITAKKNRTRFWELDFLRGFCVILMVIDHFFFSADFILKNYVWPFAGGEFWQGLQKLSEIYWVNNAHSIAHYVVVTLFFLICGVSCTLSHNNIVRGVKTLAAALVITMVTWLADAMLGLEVLIVFGVVHMLGFAMLIFSLFDLIGALIGRLLCKAGGTLLGKKDGAEGKIKPIAEWVQKLLPMAVGILGLILFFTIPLGHFGTSSTDIEILHDGIKNNVTFYYTRLFTDVTVTGSERLKNFVSIIVEIKNGGFYSSDYFPIIPYAFLILIGSGIGRLVYQTRAKNALAPLDGRWNKPVSFVGRHALLFYLLHQLVIVAFFFAAGGIYSLTH